MRREEREWRPVAAVAAQDARAAQRGEELLEELLRKVALAGEGHHAHGARSPARA